MTSEQKIIEWLRGEEALLKDAKVIARGTPIPPSGTIYEYGDKDLMEWVFNILYQESYGSYAMGYLGISSRYPAALGVRMTESEVCQANWEEIRKNILGEDGG